MSNFMTALFTAPPVPPLPGNDNPPVQFVHLEDVADASLAILKANLTGPFNVAPVDWFTCEILRGREVALRCRFRAGPVACLRPAGGNCGCQCFDSLHRSGISFAIPGWSHQRD